VIVVVAGAVTAVHLNNLNHWILHAVAALRRVAQFLIL